MEPMPVLLLAVGTGGMAGAWARYHLAGRVYARMGATFPWGTLVVNGAGCLLLGLLLPVLAGPGDPGVPRAFIVAGLTGGFTTFSTFAYEALMLLEAGEPGRAAAYVAGSLGAGLLAMAAGVFLAGLAL